MKKLNLFKDLGFMKTGVDRYVGEKKYFSTKSIGKKKITVEGIFNFDKKPSRANRLAIKGDVIQARMQYTNKAMIIDDELNDQLISTGFFQLRPPKNKITSKYLYYLLSSSSFLKQKDELCTGATQKAIGDKKLKTIEFNIPTIQEQKKITQSVDNIFSQIDKIEENINFIDKNIEIFKLNYLSKKYLQLLDTSKIVKLETLVDLKNGINFEKSAVGKSIKILGVKDFQNNFYAKTENLEKIKIIKKLNDNELLKKNDIVFVRSNGNPNFIGRTLLIDNLAEKITFTGFSIRARLKKNIKKKHIYHPYLCNILKSNLLRKKMTEDGNGIDIKSLSQGTLNNLDIPVIEFDKQVQLVKEIQKISDNSERLIHLYEKKKELLKILKDSYLFTKLN